MQCSHATHVGFVRKSNQDTLIIAEGIYGVADGMGGHKGGEIASGMAAKIIINALSSKSLDEKIISEAVSAANTRIFETGKDDSTLRGMGTTVCFLCNSLKKIYIGHVGDSRAYLLRNNELKQITQDHSLVAEMVRKEIITPKMALTHPYRNVITRAVGIEAYVKTDVLNIDKQKGDKLLVCTDGLFNMVDDEQIKQIILNHSLDEAKTKLLNAALDAGATDNVSFVLIEVSEERSA